MYKKDQNILGVDRGVGRYTASSHNQKKDNNKLKTKNNQNHEKIELYGNPPIKELKKKHPSRLVGGVKTGSWCGEDQ